MARKPIEENTTAIVDKIYPLVQQSLSKNISKYKALISKFVNDRYDQLYAVAPLDRIYFSQNDVDDFFKALSIDQKEITGILSQTYYWPMANYNPAAAKDELTVCALMVVRYFFLKKMDKELDLAITYLSFSGKFYPSCHYGSFPKAVPREYEHVMLYVINNSLSEKYDIKSQGSVIGAIRSIGKTWVETYSKDFSSHYDETYTYLIQQLHNRIKSFMKNIATEYYKSYENKEYISYDSDSIESDGENVKERITDSDALKLERYVNKTLEYITTTGVDYKICKMASDSNIRTDEIKSIMESVISNSDNISEITELLRLQIGTYLSQSKTKDISNIEFISFSIKAKPNTKDDNVLRQKEIVEDWLNENSPLYRKRKSREATRLSYNRSVMKYFTLAAYYANR